MRPYAASFVKLLPVGFGGGPSHDFCISASSPQHVFMNNFEVDNTFVHDDSLHLDDGYEINVLPHV